MCLGHALVDRLAEAPPGVIRAAGIELGAMTLVDGEAAAVIEKSLDHWEEVAGGSAANTAVGIASFGGSAAFAGSVGDDAAGARYVADLEAAGVRCVARPVTTGEPTGVSHVLVAPGGERSMATSLSAAASLSPAAVDEVGVDRAVVVYVEGYLLDAPTAAAALDRAIERAVTASTLVALSLSDPFVVDRHRDRILALLGSGAVDIVFGNEDEACSLTGESSLDAAVAALVAAGKEGLIGYVTCGAAGSVVASGAARAEVPASRVGEVVDTTGAGDLFAAGALFGLTSGRDPAAAASIGSLAAAEVITHLGARPRARLADLLPG